jgi:hypothetical protein
MAQSIDLEATSATGPDSFLQCLSHFLTPHVWKRAQQAVSRRRAWRWRAQPMLFVLLCMTWCGGDSLPERFETARAFYVALHQRRRRPGKTFAGFEKALGRLPTPLLRALAAAIRDRLAQIFAKRLEIDGFIPFGCDGSRLACPRSQELERHLSPGKQSKRPRRKKNLPPALPRTVTDYKARAACSPQLWVTAVVHLGLGILWSWRLGTGTASERAHLHRLLDTLPRPALLVADAGYVGYDLMTAMQGAGVAFLLRLSAAAPLYVPDRSTLKQYREGVVYYWPQRMQKKDLPPLPVRLWRIRGDKGDVCLITNVLDEYRLSRHSAGKFYRWRWRNEGLFRTYKRTFGKVKLMARTIAQVHREAEGSLLATQILLAQGALVLSSSATAKVPLPSARKVLLEIRAEIRNVTGMYLGPRQAQSYVQRLTQARWPDRRQRTSKVRRPWPGRQDHKPPRPPTILKMGTILKDKTANIFRMLCAVQC